MISPARSSLCPTEETLAQFLEGNLGGEQLANIEGHLDACATCVRVAAVAAGSRPRTSPPPSAPFPPAGTRIGRYILRRLVGEGAMGRVYVAHDPMLDREVALKVLNADADDPGLEARLVREAKALGRLAPHPEVITVFDAGRDGGAMYIAMEFVEGGTLRQWSASGPRSWRAVVALFLRAGSGLAHAHAAGLVHRDFKPDNVLVGSDGRIRVTDFGLARPGHGATTPAEPMAGGDAAPSTFDATLTRTGALVGTPAYMAPEQFAGRLADARSDIFSFCVTFYEALYGERPFSARTLRELAEATASGRISSPPAGRSVPPRLRRALLVGLRARPESRYASMSELLAAISLVARAPRAPYVVLVSLLVLGPAVMATPFLSRRLGGVAPSPQTDVSEIHAEVEVPVRPGSFQPPVTELPQRRVTAAPDARPSPRPAARDLRHLAAPVRAPSARPEVAFVALGANKAPIIR